jgi:hypothetical protein
MCQHPRRFVENGGTSSTPPRDSRRAWRNAPATTIATTANTDSYEHGTQHRRSTFTSRGWVLATNVRCRMAYGS